MNYFIILLALLALAPQYQTKGNEITNSRLNFFDTDLFLACAEDEKHANVLISPASVKSVLAMLLEGAGGKTAAEIISALRLSPVKEEFREQINGYINALKRESNSSVILNANGLFVTNKLKLNPEYETMMKYVYMSEIHHVDFLNSATATDMINRWVTRRTSGLIPELVEAVHISPSTNVLIANAIYFRSSWRHAFSKGLTSQACFFRKGTCRKVDMMELQAKLKYAFVENLRAHAVELPYSDERYSMILLVPRDKDGWSTLIRDLPYMNLPQISTLMTINDVYLTLPKFAVDYSEDLVPVLRNTKINEIFSSSSNISGIFSERDHVPQVNNFYHKVFLQVDEEGTVAAATTGAMVVPLIGAGITLTVDRPFLFFIRDNEMGLVLFSGKIEEPSAAMETSTTKKPIEENIVKIHNITVNILLNLNPDSGIKTTTEDGVRWST